MMSVRSRGAVESRWSNLERRRERRRDIGHATMLQIAKLTTGRGEELCILRDISSGGAKAIVYCTLDQGEPVVIALKTGYEIAGRVAWRSGDAIGIAFDRRVAVLEILAHRVLDRFGYRIRPLRLTVDLPTALDVEGERIDVRIMNISQGGGRLSVKRRLGFGQHCDLLLPALGKRGVIARWWRNGEAGISLKQPLNYSEFAAWRQAMEAMPDGAPQRYGR